MHLTKFTDNALRVLIFLSSDPTRKRNITEIAETCEIPRNHLTKVVHAMGQKGLLTTARGKGGGVTLARDPADMKVGDVIRAMEGTEEIINCDNPLCPFLPDCNLRGMLRQAQNAFLDTLDQYSIAEIYDAGPALQDAIANSASTSK